MDVHRTLDDTGMATWHAVSVVERKNTASSLPRVSEVHSQRKKSPDLDEIGQHTPRQLNRRLLVPIASTVRSVAAATYRQARR